jgi:hypothetical protein
MPVCCLAAVSCTLVCVVGFHASSRVNVCCFACSMAIGSVLYAHGCLWHGVAGCGLAGRRVSQARACWVCCSVCVITCVTCAVCMPRPTAGYARTVRRGVGMAGGFLFCSWQVAVSHCTAAACGCTAAVVPAGRTQLHYGQASGCCRGLLSITIAEGRAVRLCVLLGNMSGVCLVIESTCVTCGAAVCCAAVQRCCCCHADLVWLCMQPYSH